MKNREIKFRVFTRGILAKVNFIDFDFGTVDFDDNGVATTTSLNAVDLMQFTGLRDANGKDVYEGDIVTDTTWGEGEVKFGDFMVEGGDYYSNFCRAGWYVRFLKKEDCTEDLDTNHIVIGNIYQNPELLKK